MTVTQFALAYMDNSPVPVATLLFTSSNTVFYTAWSPTLDLYIPV